MLSNDPTFIGEVASVSSSSVNVYLAKSIASGLSIIEGRAYRIGQVGSFVRIPQGYQDLFGIISEIGAKAAPQIESETGTDVSRWVQVQLFGESIGGVFERGISHYPNVGDNVHLVTQSSLARIYGTEEFGHIVIGSLSSAESIPANIALDELITRHSAVLGSTGSGKSTKIASLLQAITDTSSNGSQYPSARILLLDIHGEYPDALADVANVFSVHPRKGEKNLYVPYWALSASELLQFLTGGMESEREAFFTDKILDLKLKSHEEAKFPGISANSITVDTPLPFSLKKLWHELIDIENTTFEGANRDIPTRIDYGSAENLIEPQFKPSAMGPKGPFLNPQAHGIRRELNTMRSFLLDRRYDFLLNPGDWTPDLDGKTNKDLDSLLQGWMGDVKPITILDLSSVPSMVLARLVGSILKVVFEALYWSRDKSEGGIFRPLLIVMEEAHRYLSSKSDTATSIITQQIAKEGRKYGVGLMVVSQRPSEVDETILSQCGTIFALRLTNPVDRERIKGTFPDGLLTLLDALPILRTGEAIVMGEATKLPMRYRVTLPPTLLQPKSLDPDVSKNWALDRKPEEGYDRVIASWRAQESRTATWYAQDSRTVAKETIIEQKTTTNKYENE